MWSDYKTTLTNLITSNNYREVPENKIVDVSATSHNHLAFALKPIGIGEVMDLSSNGIQYSHKIELQLKYKNIDSTERASNYDSFLNLFKAITALADYKGTISDPEFTDIDEKHTKGLFRFLFGLEVQC